MTTGENIARIGTYACRKRIKFTRAACRIPVAILLILFMMLPQYSILASEAESTGSTLPVNQNSKTLEKNDRALKISVNVDLVTTDVMVTGRGATDLCADDFLIYDNGVPQEVAAFSYDQLPIDIVLLISNKGIIKKIGRSSPT